MRLAVWFFALVLAAPAQAVVFTVDSTVDAVDAVPGDGICADASGACTLRAAIHEANVLPGADVVEVPAGTYVGGLGITDSVTGG